MSILTVIPFHQGDALITKELLLWIKEITVGKLPDLLLAADSTTPLETCKEIAEIARSQWRKVHTASIRVDVKDWRAPNYMFHTVTKHVRDTFRTPFFWMEPDCIPLNPNWLSRLEDHYEDCAKHYMGCFIETDNDKEPNLPRLHMAGCSIYPANAHDLLAKFCDTNATSAWDMGMAAEMCVQQKAESTQLVQHYWGTKELAPTFVVKREQGKEYPINCIELSFLKPDAVLFHRCKDGSLIRCLREHNSNTLKIKHPKKQEPGPAALAGMQP